MRQETRICILILGIKGLKPEAKWPTCCFIPLACNKDGHEVIDITIVYSIKAIKSFGLAIDSAECRLKTLQTSKRRIYEGKRSAVTL